MLKFHIYTKTKIKSWELLQAYIQQHLESWSHPIPNSDLAINSDLPTLPPSLYHPISHNNSLLIFSLWDKLEINSQLGLRGDLSGNTETNVRSAAARASFRAIIGLQLTANDYTFSLSLSPCFIHYLNSKLDSFIFLIQSGSTRLHCIFVWTNHWYFNERRYFKHPIFINI